MELRNADGLTEQEFLARYNPKDYERPSVTVDMLVFGMDKSLNNLKLLLIKRKDHPFLGHWALSGGFINPDESAYQAACRELEEETGLKDVYLEQFYIMTKPNRDPRMRVMSIDYLALVKTTEISAGDDAEEAIWFDISMTNDKLELYNKENGLMSIYHLERKEFSNGSIFRKEGYVAKHIVGFELAFDHVDSIIEGLLRLRNNLESSDVAFTLLDEEFTLPDLQHVYEVILNKTYYKTNFKSSMLGKITPVAGKKGVSITGGRSSQLYRYSRGLPCQ